MKHKLLILIFCFALTLLFGNVVQVSACSCYSRTICETFGDAKAVFIGEVVEGTSLERMSDTIGLKSNELQFMLDVRESFEGVKEHTKVPIYTGLGFGDCGFPFEKGESYLVYAYEDKGKLYTSICSGSRHVSRVEPEEFKFLENAAKNRWKGGRVFGNVSVITSRKEVDFQTRDTKEPIPRVTLRFLNGFKVETIQTDQNGNYQVDGLNAGDYRLELVLPENYIFDRSRYVLYAESQNWESRKFEIGAGGCKEEDFDLINDSSLVGQLTGSDGIGLAKASIQLIPINSPDQSPQEEVYETSTSEVGKFNLTRVPVGKYLLGINLAKSPDEKQPYQRTFYPGTTDRAQATVIEVKLGQKISSLDLQATQKLVPRKVRGIVTFEDGKPAANVSVTLEDVNYPKYCVNGCNNQTDSQGRFELTGYEDYTYFVMAYDLSKSYDGFSQKTVSNPANFKLNGDFNDLKLTLVIKPKKE